MAWTAPRTWVALAKLRAAHLNVDIRDNLNWLKSAVDTNTDNIFDTDKSTQHGAIGGITDGSGELTIALPAGVYATAPVVVACAGDVLGFQPLQVVASSVTASSFRVRAYDASGVPLAGTYVAVNWHAHGTVV